MAVTVLCTYSKMLLQEHFEADDSMELRHREYVVLSTRRGLEVGRVAALPGTRALKRDESTAGRVLRRASTDDIAHDRGQRVTFAKLEPLKIARRLAAEASLEMRFVDFEETLDHSKLIFYFTAEGRVDFRDLVRSMAGTLNKRIELRQIGARDVARLTGDVGSCGEELCCKKFLVDFVPVSMKMAKNQGVSLDSSKVSGMCGRLKCCLKYEDSLYTELRKVLPRQGQPCMVGEEEAWVYGVNMLNQTVSISFSDNRREELPAAEITFEQMSEKAVKRYQKQRREHEREEYERRQAEREARRRATSERRASPLRSGDSGRRRDSRRNIDAEKAANNPQQQAPATTAEGQGARTDADGKPKRKRRRRRRSRRRADGPSDNKPAS